MSFERKRTLTTLLCMSTFALPMTAPAGTQFEWKFKTGPTYCAGGSIATACNGEHANEAHQITFKEQLAGGPNLIATGWVNSGGSNDSLVADELTIWGSGLGMENLPESESSPWHAFDNKGLYELVLLDLGESMALTNINIGYAGPDADISLLAYDFSGTNDALNPAGVLYKGSDEELTDRGWKWVGNYDLGGSNADGKTGTGNTLVNAGGTESQYWIVASYNNAFKYDSWSLGNDAYKIHSAGAMRSDSRVPTPPTLLLMAIGLAWLGRQQLKIE